MGDAASGDGHWIRKAVELSPLIRSCRSGGEAAYRMSPEAVEALGDAGLFRLAIPVESDVVSLTELIEVHEQLGYADPSLAWASANSNGAAALIGRLPHEHGRDLIGSETRFIGVGLPPTGRADVRGEELTVSGRWPLVSGSADADWFVVNCIFHNEQGAPQSAGALVEARFVLVPARDVAVEDTWRGVIAVRGSGSNAIKIEGAVVPLARSISMTGPSVATDSVSLMNAAAPVAIAMLEIAAISIGIGRSAVEAAITQAGARISIVNQAGWADWPSVQNTVATVDMAVVAARAALYSIVKDAQQELLDGVLTPTTRARLYSVTEHAMLSMRHGVSDLFTVGSVDSLRSGHGLEQSLRDIHAFGVNWERYRRLHYAAGRALLGSDPKEPIF